MDQEKWKKHLEIISGEKQEKLIQRHRVHIKLLSDIITTRNKAHAEEVEVLSDELYNKVSLQEEKLDLYLLEELLGEYLRKKGLKESMIKLDELQRMISIDRNKTSDQLHDKNHLIEEIEKLKEK